MKSFFLFIFFLSVSSHALKSEMYLLGSDFKNKIFEMNSESTSENGILNSKAIFTDAKDNSVVFVDESKTKDGEFLETKITQKQTGESAHIYREGDQIFFEYTSGEGKVKKANEKVKDFPVMTTATFLLFIKKNWATLKKDKKIKIRLAVWDRLETVGLEILLENSENAQEVKLKMKPSSFLISVLVDPIFLWFNEDGSQILKMKGRIAPKQKKSDQWKTVDADVKYSY